MNYDIAIFILVLIGAILNTILLVIDLKDKTE